MAPLRFAFLLVASWRACLVQAFEGIFVSNGNGTSDLDGAGWDAALAHPNASASFSFAAPNVTQQWPSTLINGWEFTIKVKADLPIPKSPQWLATGTEISLTPPQSLLHQNGSFESVQVDPNWVACMSFYLPDDLQGSFKNGSFDGSCKGTLPDACIEDLQDRGTYSSWANGHCDIPDIPNSCPDSLKKNMQAFGTGRHPDFNGSAVAGFAVETHQAGNNTAYDKAVKAVWPILVKWAVNSTTNSSNGFNQGPNATLMCLQADTVLPGSRVPGAAPGLTASTGWLAVTLALSLLLITL